MKIKIKLTENSIKPQYKTIGAAAADCYANCSKWVWLKPCLIPLGISLEIPEGYEAQVRPRSGLSLKGHFVSFGTIDCDYRGEVKACMWSLLPFRVKKGDRVCQLYFGKAEQVELEESDNLSETERGQNGFGSTGV